MSALRELLAKLDIEVTGADKAKHAEGALEGFKKAAEGVAKFLAVGAIAEGVKSMVEGLEQQAVQLSKTSQILGINTADLQAWQFAAKLSGVEAEAFAGGVKKLEINAGKAAEAGAQTGGEFQKLGVNLREDAGGPMRDVQEILHDTGMAIARLPDPMTRADAVMKTFGKSGSALIPLFNKGEAGLKEMLDEIDKLGGGISEDAIGKLEDMHQATSKWDMALTSAKSALVVQFLPALTAGITAGTKWIASFMQNKFAMEALKSVVITLGIVGAAAGVEFIAPWLPAIAGFVLLAAVVDEFRVGLSGGKTVIGEVLDKLYGEGAGKTFFATVKADAEALIATIKELLALIKKGGAPAVAREALNEVGIKTDLGSDYANQLTKTDLANERAGKTTHERDVARIQAAKESPTALRWTLSPSESSGHGTVNASRYGELRESTLGTLGESLRNFSRENKAIQDVMNRGAAPEQASLWATLKGSVATGEKAGAKPQTVTQSNNIAISITAKSGDAKDIADSTGNAVQEQNRANLAALQTMAAPK